MNARWNQWKDSLWRTRFVARLTIAFGRLWPLLVPSLVVVGLFLAISWFGLFRHMPDIARIAVLGLFFVAFLASLLALLRFRWPGPAEIDRHIEKVNHLAHAPIRAQSEQLAGEPDAFARALWQEHKARLARDLDGLAGGLPRTGLPDRDPWGLRAAVALLVVTGFAWSLGSSGGSIADAWRPARFAVSVPPRIDAWITPPAYTGKAPVFLAMTGKAGRGETLRVPVDSVLTARASGGKGEFALQIRTGDDGILAADEDPASTGQAQQFAITLRQSGEAVLLDADEIRQSWDLAVVPDQPPRIEFDGDPRQAVNGALEFSYEIEDDYGIAAAEAAFEIAQTGPAPARPLFEAPDFPLSLPGRGDAKARMSRDLTAHPWAGVPVRMQLRATDDRGQQAQSASREFILPERNFTHPLAKAVIEQRRILALDANGRRRVQDMLDALLLWPEVTIGNAAHFLALSVAQRRLEQAGTDERLREVVDYLWEVARGIEDGSLSAAEQRLMQAQEALREALERGAGEEEIEQLMAELREAMREFLRELAERAMQDPSLAQQMPDGMQMNQSELERMLDQIENLARSGARDEAQELLSQLQGMMNNLQAMRPGQPSAGQDQMRQQMDQLGDLMRRQQELMNETFRTEQLRRGPQGQEGQMPQPGQQGEQGGGMSAQEFAEAMRRLTPDTTAAEAADLTPAKLAPLIRQLQPRPACADEPCADALASAA